MKQRRGEVRVNGIPAGILEETANGFRFCYDSDYVRREDCSAISLSLPKRLNEPFESPILFPFFAGLLAEGTAMQLQCRLLKLDENDYFGRLLKTARDDVIGPVTVHEMKEECS